MGRVARLVLQLRSSFWPVPNFGFIHAPDEDWQTWWSDERGPVLTAWTGGPRAERLEAQAPEDLLESALQVVARIFHVEQRRVRELLLAHYHHDWTHDPFARGAYSYTPVAMTHMPGLLAAPATDTLFFAGEATDATGNQGTVHGSLASGRRAAREILRLAGF